MVRLPISMVQVDNGIEARKALSSEDPYKPPDDLIIGGCVETEVRLAAVTPELPDFRQKRREELGLLDG